MKNFIVRGILVGSSVGVLLHLAHFSNSLARAFLVGAVAGALAGYTLWRRQNKDKKKN